MTTDNTSHQPAEDTPKHHDSSKKNQLKTSDTDIEAAAQSEVTLSDNLPPSKENKASDKKPREVAATSDEDNRAYLYGWRFGAILSLTTVVFFMVIVETSIVTTSTVNISADIGGFERASWILSAYSLGFVSLVVVISKLSDIFGRKPVYMLCILLFSVFSGASAASQTMTQLIIFRSLQGVGGGGSYAMAGIMIISMVTPKDYAKVSSYTGVAFILAMVLGPTMGVVSVNTGHVDRSFSSMCLLVCLRWHWPS